MKKKIKKAIFFIFSILFFLISIYALFNFKINPGYSLTAYFHATIENHNQVGNTIHYKKDTVAKYKEDKDGILEKELKNVKMTSQFSLYFVTPDFDYEYCYGYNLFLGKDHISFMIRRETTPESKRTAYHLYNISKEDGDKLSKIAEEMPYCLID